MPRQLRVAPPYCSPWPRARQLHSSASFSSLAGIASLAVYVVLDKRGYPRASVAAFVVAFALSVIILEVLRRKGSFGIEGTSTAWNRLPVQAKLQAYKPKENANGYLLTVPLLVVVLCKIAYDESNRVFHIGDLLVALILASLSGFFIWIRYGSIEKLSRRLVERRLRKHGIEPVQYDKFPH